MRTICYYPELVQVTGSINAALMMAQLEFWFKVMNGKPFYKFLEPCTHELYKVGDSWSEELGMTTSEIRSAFKRIGTMHKSKSAFLESKDIFKGKPYAAYYDRIRKTTYYFRNDDKVGEMMPQDHTKECMAKTLLERDSSVQEDTKRDSSVQEGTKRDGSGQQENLSRRDGSDRSHDQQIDTKQNLSSVNEETPSRLYREDYRIDYIEDNLQESLQRSKQTSSLTPFEEIVSLYNDILGEKLGYIRQLTFQDKNQLKHLWQHHQLQLDDFKKAFKKAAASKFLCGQVQGKNWRASFKWLLTKEHLTKVLEGFYDDFIAPIASTFKPTVLDKIKYLNQIESHHFDFDEIEKLERLYIDKKLETLCKI